MALGQEDQEDRVVSGVCDGFIGNRMIEQYVAARPASCWTRAPRRSRSTRRCEKFGFAMGPFRMGDLAGNDIGWAIRKRRYAENAGHALQPNIADQLCELGRFGQKTGAGWYDYEPGKRDPIPIRSSTR